MTSGQEATIGSGAEELLGRLDALTDLFRRRLLDDKDKRRVIDELTDRLRVAEQGLFSQALQPLVAGLVLVIDRCDHYSGGDQGFADSIREELLELLTRHGVGDVDVSGSVDPACHEVVGVVEAEDPVSLPVVHRVVRRGFVRDGRVVRPAQVIALVNAPERNGSPTR